MKLKQLICLLLAAVVLGACGSPAAPTEATEETKTLYHADIILSLGSRAKPEEIGANLFKTLRKFDFLGVDVVYSEVFSEKGEGMAIMNRLNKAAGYRVLEAE